ncbi:MAG: helix-turn-helix domain-containing protein [Rhizobiales bacterium]|nr:helix-turn-helix domain-containing protein [Hyphomicrobiales bacterium]
MARRSRPVRKNRPEPGNSLERMVALLDLFEESPSGWTFERIHSRLGYTRSTLYRYLKVLSDAELLSSLPEAGYTLGPRIVELDYEIRAHDPIIRASRPLMRELVQEVPGIALLCRSYRSKVLCVHQERSTTEIESTYERGRTMPLLRGAASRIILANMPSRTIATLFGRQPREFAGAGLGDTLAAVQESLKRIRKAGWDQTTGEVTKGITGIAAPIFGDRDKVLGSLSISFATRSMNAKRIGAIAERVVSCAGIVTQTIARGNGTAQTSVTGRKAPV